jgi:nucleoside 2-deoxyribosyltransferase
MPASSTTSAPSRAPRPRVYLAGPELFFVDADARYAELKSICAEYGLDGVAPTDGLAVTIEPTPLCAFRIYRHDIAMLRSCQGAVANLAPFRGTEPDSGTAFEVGFAVALGLPVCGYVGDNLDLLMRVRMARPCYEEAGGLFRDKATGAAVEDFGMPLNLMLACGSAVSAAPVQAISALAKQLLRDA